MTAITNEVRTHWATISPILSIRNEREYDLAIKRLAQLLDEIGTNERHPLYGLLDALGTLIHAYEERHHPMPECSGGDMLRHFIEEHGLKQSYLPEVGSQGVVSEILDGKRELNVRHSPRSGKTLRGVASSIHIEWFLCSFTGLSL